MLTMELGLLADMIFAENQEKFHRITEVFSLFFLLEEFVSRKL